jgi:uncharacterized protein (TIGR04255 family)
MSGRFSRAPLVYVTARIQMASMPPLTEDQQSLISQKLLALGFVVFEKSEIAHIEIDVGSKSDGSNSGNIVRKNKLHRLGFFDGDRTSSLILDPEGMEFRCSSYSKYEEFIEKFSQVVRIVIEQLPDLGKAQIRELILTYSDIIVGLPEFPLDRLFSNQGAYLPIRQHVDGDGIFFGVNQVTQVPVPTEKITVTIEQLPNNGKEFAKLLPQVLIELDNSFRMPLILRDEWRNVSDETYVLLMTQASKIFDTEFASIDVTKEFQSVHELTKSTFRRVVDFEVCKQAWGWTG